MAFGLAYLRPFLESVDYLEAVCTTTSATMPSRSRYSQCRCVEADRKCHGNKDAPLYGSGHVMHTGSGDTVGGVPWVSRETCAPRCEDSLCYSCFPCLQIKVRYTAKHTHFEYGNGSLFEAQFMLEDGGILQDAGVSMCYISYRRLG